MKTAAMIIALRAFALSDEKKYWAGIQDKVKAGMRVQLRFKSVCTSAQFDQSLSFPPEESLTLDYP